MKYLLNVLFFCIITFAVHAEEKMIIPNGIRYKAAQDKVNKEAIQLLKKLFSGTATDQDVLSLFENKTLICGPGLWHDIKTNEAMSKINTGKGVFQMPVLDDNGKIIRMDKLEGKLFQSPDEVLAFWKAFTQKTDFSDLEIRKLNPDELRIFWAMIPFDITEPLFILQSRKHKILAAFTAPDKLKIMWIDDYRNMSFKKEKNSGSPDAGSGR